MHVVLVSLLHDAYDFPWHVTWQSVFALAVHSPEQLASHFVVQLASAGTDLQDVSQ
jgi:hypothetical protein